MIDDGKSKCVPLVNFYKYTFLNIDIQKQLTDCLSKKQFVELAVRLGQEYGYKFKVDEMMESVSPFTLERLPEFDTTGWEGFEWEKKLTDVGWSPLGYSR